MTIASLTLIEQHTAILASTLAALTTVLVAIRGLRKRTEEIHVLVNSRLDEALQRIEELETQLLAAHNQPQREGTEEHG